MAHSLGKELAALRRMTVRELRQKYELLFGEACRSHHKEWLIKRIAWRLQANEEGDLSERARRRAEELANDADLRLKPPVPQPEAETSGPTGTGRRVPRHTAPAAGYAADPSLQGPAAGRDCPGTGL